MKIKKTLLAAIALGVSVGVTTTSCSKPDIKPQEEEVAGDVQQELGPEDFNFELIEGTRSPIPPYLQCNCPTCGLG